MGLQGYFDNCVNPILCLVLYWLFSLVSFFSRSVEGGVGRILLFQISGRGERAAFPRQLGHAARVGYDTA